MGLAKKIPYLAPVLVFLAAWALTLIGLAVVQNRCSDSSAAVVSTFAFFTETGGNCRKFFQLPWFILALNSVPVLLVAVSMIKPHLAKGATTAFFAVLAPLNILMAHAFYSAAASPAIEEDSGDAAVRGTDKDWYRVTLSGFAILAAMSLFLVLADSLLAGDAEERYTDRERVGGKGEARRYEGERVSHV